MSDFGLFVLRVIAGGYMIKYGFPKLSDSDGEFAKEFEGLGFQPARTFVSRAGIVEVAAGALLALGALGPLGPMMLLSDMVVAATATAARAKRFDFDQHEEEALFAAVALLLALGGPGSISIDSALGIRLLNCAWMRLLSVPAALGGAAYMLSKRTPIKGS